MASFSSITIKHKWQRNLVIKQKSTHNYCLQSSVANFCKFLKPFIWTKRLLRLDFHHYQYSRKSNSKKIYVNFVYIIISLFFHPFSYLRQIVFCSLKIRKSINHWIWHKNVQLDITKNQTTRWWVWLLTCI